MLVRELAKEKNYMELWTLKPLLFVYEQIYSYSVTRQILVKVTNHYNSRNRQRPRKNFYRDRENKHKEGVKLKPLTNKICICLRLDFPREFCIISLEIKVCHVGIIWKLRDDDDDDNNEFGVVAAAAAAFEPLSNSLCGFSQRRLSTTHMSHMLFSIHDRGQ